MPRHTHTKREDGYFKCYYHGKQFYGKTLAEAEAKRDLFIRKENMGLNPNMEDFPFLEFALHWVETNRTECGKAQQRQYINMVKFAAENLPHNTLRTITTYDLQHLLNSMSVYSASHVSKFISVLNGIFKAAYNNGAVLRNPMAVVKRPKCKKTQGHRSLEDWERKLIRETCQEHDFGLAAMVMMYAGLRRGEMLYLDIDRDVDFENNTISVQGAVSFCHGNGNQPTISEGKTDAAIRIIPLVKPLAEALKGHHGLLCTRENGKIMSQAAFDRKYDSYITFLETRLNGCHKRWYGKTNEHKRILAEGGELPKWRNVTIRCHDFRVDFCTRAYYANVPLKTLQCWMGHSDVSMILDIYTKLSKQQEIKDTMKYAKLLDSQD